METLTNISKIKEYFPQHSTATVKMFIAIVNCMVQLRTTCLYKCKDKMSAVRNKKQTKSMSYYKGIIRFFKIPFIPRFCEGIFLFIIALLGIESNMLVLDRTNWKIGKKNINLLTLGVLFHNCFIPLCWKQLDKRGNSNFIERRELVDRFVGMWKKATGKVSAMVLVADREFIGPEWMQYLRSISMSFVFRLKDNMYFSLRKTGKKTPIANVCQRY